MGSQKANIEGHCLKRGAATVLRFKGGLGKKDGGGFLGEVGDTLMYTMILYLQ